MPKEVRPVSKMRIMVATAGASILMQAGCSGGGSPATSQSSIARDSIELGGGVAVTSSDIHESAATAATARAKFGSVTQSSNVAGEVTTDTANAEFEEGQLRFSVTRADGSVENFVPPSEELDEFDAPDSDSGRSSQSWTLVGSADGNARSIAFAAANWNQQAAQSDWLVQGVWIRIPDIESPTPESIEIGTFVDGPEIERDADLSGVGGTATYGAIVSGLYVAEFPDSVSPQESDEPQVGIFNSELRLVADFVANTVSGSIGAENGIEIIEFSDDATPERVSYRISLDSATINDNGRIESGSVSVRTDLDRTIASSGSWSGRFSSENAESGNPRRVGGTVGTSFRVGSQLDVVLLGSFLGAPVN